MLSLSKHGLRSATIPTDVRKLPAEYPGWMLTMWSEARTKQLAQAK